jgi:TatD DNase family protein
MDFHCHLDLYPDAREVYAEAVRRNRFTWLVTTSPKAFVATSRVLGTDSRVLITPGLHPELVHDRAGELELLLQQMAGTNAVGEVGLDGSARYRASYAAQLRVFAEVVQRCRELGGRTLSIHSRQAVKDVLRELERNPGYGTAILHWFTGSATELQAAELHGCWFSVGPAMFASASGRAIAARLPRERVVPESDGPFAKVDGQPVMPWSAAATSARLAEVWNCDESQAANLLTANSKKLLAVMQSL